jgi:hypothetical protein
MALTFDSGQQTAIDAEGQTVVWLFHVQQTDLTNYYWSTRYYDGTGILLDEYDEAILDENDATILSGVTYSSKVGSVRDSFAGVKINRLKSERGVTAGMSLKFTAHNASDTLSASDFDNAKVVLRELINDEVIRVLTFVVKTCEPGPQKLRFTCVDYIQKYLDGDYPNSRLVRDIFPEDISDLNDNVCVPLGFGTAYLPIRSDYISADTKRYYILGQTSTVGDFSVSEVRSPRMFSKTGTVYTSGSYTFNKYIKADADATDWLVLEPIILDSDNDDAADAAGFWVSGQHFLDMPCKYQQTTPNLAGMTSPEEVIEYILEDFGIPSAMLDTGGGSTFESAGTTFVSRGITWNGGWWYKQPRRKVLAQLLNMCNATLICAEKIELHVLSNTSVDVKAGQANVTTAYIAKAQNRDVSPSSFQYRTLTNISQHDSGVVGYAPNSDAQDRLLTITVPTTTTKATPSGEILELPLIGDSQVAQKLGTLYYGKKLLPVGRITFRGNSALSRFQPNDFLTTSGTGYGGTKTVMVDSLQINKNGSIDFSCIEFSATMSDYDWGDLAPGAVTHNADSATVPMSVSTFGPDVSGGIDPLYVDNIYEKTASNGIVIDGMTVKDGGTQMVYRASWTMALVSDQIFNTRVSGDTNPRFYMTVPGKMFFGGGSAPADVSLYRSAADTLALAAGDTFTADAAEIDSITLGTGGAADEISTDDTLAGDSDTVLVSESGVKGYVDTHIADTTTHGTTGDIVGTTDAQTLTNKTLTSPTINSSAIGSAVLDEDNMASNSDTKLATQQSIKAYVDTLGGGYLDISTYDPATISEQLVGLAAAQTLTNKTLTSPVLNTGLSGTAFLDEDTLSSDSATKAASQQSIKAYVDNGTWVSESTWTPVINTTNDDAVVTHNVQQGQYAKFGNIVIFQGMVSLSAITTAGTGGIKISGLPHSVKNVASGYWPLSLTWSNLDLTKTVAMILAVANTSYMQIYEGGDNTARSLLTQPNALTASTAFRIAGVYITE